MYTKAKHSISSIFRMINSIFSLRFLRYVDFFPGIFWINIGMSDRCFLTKSTKTALKKKELKCLRKIILNSFWI